MKEQTNRRFEGEIGKETYTTCCHTFTLTAYGMTPDLMVLSPREQFAGSFFATTNSSLDVPDTWKLTISDAYMQPKNHEHDVSA